MTSASINDLIEKRHRVMVFGASSIKSTKINAKMNGALLLIDRDRIRHPGCASDWIKKPSLVEFLDFYLNGWSLSRMDKPLLLPNRGCIYPCVDTMLNNVRIKPDIYE